MSDIAKASTLGLFKYEINLCCFCATVNNKIRPMKCRWCISLTSGLCSRHQRNRILISHFNVICFSNFAEYFLSEVFIHLFSFSNNSFLFFFGFVKNENCFIHKALIYENCLWRTKLLKQTHKFLNLFYLSIKRGLVLSLLLKVLIETFRLVPAFRENRLYCPFCIYREVPFKLCANSSHLLATFQL